MELSQDEKDRIVAEEKLRMETRKEFFKDHFGHGRWGGPWRGGFYDRSCHPRCGGGFVKILVLALVVFAACHFWHHNCCTGGPGYGYGAPAYPMQQAPAPPVKN